MCARPHENTGEQLGVQYVAQGHFGMQEQPGIYTKYTNQSIHHLTELNWFAPVKPSHYITAQLRRYTTKVKEAAISFKGSATSEDWRRGGYFHFIACKLHPRQKQLHYIR